MGTGIGGAEAETEGRGGEGAAGEGGAERAVEEGDALGTLMGGHVGRAPEARKTRRKFSVLLGRLAEAS